MGGHRPSSSGGHRTDTRRRGRDRDPRGSAALLPPRRAGGGPLSTSFAYPCTEFDELFKTFEHTAFRLEIRERYNEPDEQQEIADFLAGNGSMEEWDGWWLPNVRKATAEGRRFERVRVVSIPPSDYTRFGLWASHQTVGAGEDIRYLLRTKAETAGLPNHDYWPSDSRKLARMHFDEADDRLLSIEIIEDDYEQIVQHNCWCDAAWHHAARREDFAAEHQFRAV